MNITDLPVVVVDTMFSTKKDFKKWISIAILLKIFQYYLFKTILIYRRTGIVSHIKQVHLGLHI